MRPIRLFVLFTACVLGGALLALLAGAGDEGPAAPELTPNRGWLNTDKPLRFSDELKGHVVLLDFWTLCCINCMHVIPDLEHLEQKYADQPFLVVGVHSAKFQNEATRQSIRSAIFRYHIRHPVVIDDDFGVWRKYGADGWPTLVLVGADGRIAMMTSGEGQRAFLDRAVQRALDSAREKGTLAAHRFQPTLDAAAPSTSGLAFPGKVVAQPPSARAPGRVFISDSSHNRVVVAAWPDAAGVSRLIGVFGDGRPGLVDGEAARARFNDPQGLALDAEHDTLYVADTRNHAIRRIDLAAATVITAAGNGEQSYDREGGRMGKAQGLNSPWGLTLAPIGSPLYIAMAGSHQIWAMDTATRRTYRVAGSGHENILDGAATDAALAQPSGIALSSDGHALYVADSEVSAVRRIDTETGATATIIGKGLFAFGDTDGAYPEARLQHPLGITLLPTPDGDRLLVADTYNHKIKLVDPVARTSALWTGAGRGMNGSDDALRLDEPGGLFLARPADGDPAAERLFIADTNNNRVVIVDPATRAWTELVIAGLEDGSAPAPAPPPGAPETPVATALGKPLSLSLTAALPPGRELNPEAPVSIRVSTLDGAAATAVAQRTLRANAFPVTIGVPASAVTEGSRLLVELSFVSCDHDAALCAPGDATWVVRIAKGDGQSASLRAAAP